MTNAHQLLALVTAAFVLALLVVAIASWWTSRRTGASRDHRFAVDRLVLAVVAATTLTGAVGLAMLAAGDRPADPLHLTYGIAAALTAPLAWAAGGRSDRRRRDAWLAMGAAVLVGIGVRLAMTG